MSDIVKAQFSLAIEEGMSSLSEMLARIDAYHIKGKLTDEERSELIAEARAAAADQFAETLNIVETLTAFGQRLNALEAAVAELQGSGNPDDPGEETPPEYAVGHWYYNGDRVTYEGVAYTCVAPDGVVVVWSPAETPQYWEADPGE